MTESTGKASAEQAEPMSRRGMLRFGALAAATVAGTAGAAALAGPAQAAPGDPIKIDDAANTGAGVTQLAGSSVAVKASNATTAAGVANAAVVGSPAAGAASAVGVAGVGAGTTGAGLYAANATGPALIVEQSPAAFPPTTGRWKVGAVLAVQDTLFQCVFSDGAADSLTVWAPLTNHGFELTLLPTPTRVYASTKDAGRNFVKIARGQYRRIDTINKQTGGLSGVPPWATAVLASVQIESTEAASGYLSIATGDNPQPVGFSTVVWSSAGFAGVTSFTSALGQADTTTGTITVGCNSAHATAKTHFYIDIVGYYADTYVFGGPDAAQLSQDARTGALDLAKLRSKRARG